MSFAGSPRLVVECALGNSDLGRRFLAREEAGISLRDVQEHVPDPAAVLRKRSADKLKSAANAISAAGMGQVPLTYYMGQTMPVARPGPRC